MLRGDFNHLVCGVVCHPPRLVFVLPFRAVPHSAGPVVQAHRFGGSAAAAGNVDFHDDVVPLSAFNRPDHCLARGAGVADPGTFIHNIRKRLVPLRRIGVLTGVDQAFADLGIIRQPDADNQRRGLLVDQPALDRVMIAESVPCNPAGQRFRILRVDPGRKGQRQPRLRQEDIVKIVRRVVLEYQADRPGVADQLLSFVARCAVQIDPVRRQRSLPVLGSECRHGA